MLLCVAILFSESMSAFAYDEVSISDYKNEMDIIADETVPEAEIIPEEEVLPADEIVQEDEAAVEPSSDMGTVNEDLINDPSEESKDTTDNAESEDKYTSMSDNQLPKKARPIEFTEDMVLSIPDQVYTSEPIRPDVTVCYDGRYLEKGVDYGVIYNDNVNAGRASATISGIGEFMGSIPITVYFNITKKDISTLSINGILDQDGNSISYFYSGAVIEPVSVLHARGNGKKAIDVTKDLKITYKNNINVGQATVTIVGTGNYQGKIVDKFTIYPRDVADSAINYKNTINDRFVNTFRYTMDEVKPPLTINNIGSGRNVLLTEKKDYTLSYDYNVFPGIAEITVTGVKNYTGQKTIYFEIAKRDIGSLNISVANQEYTGSEIEPEVVVKDGSIILRNTIDYNVIYENNIDCGTATITITAPVSSPYSGTTTRTFSISRKDLSTAVLEDVSNYTYISGSNVIYNQDAMKVRLGSDILRKDIDYKVECTNNVASSIRDVTATVKVTGINNYKGVVSTTYTISPYGGATVRGKKRLDDFTDSNWSVTLQTNGLNAQEIIYTGKEQKPPILVKYMGTTLKENVDYYLSYNNNTNKGVASVTIRAKNDSQYVGNRKIYFYIIGRPINGEGTVEGGFSVRPPKKVVYNGGMNEPGVTIKYLGKPLKEGKDYTLRYFNNGSVTDNARVEVTGIGDYSKSLTFVFSIVPYDLSKASYRKVTSKTYTGYEIRPDVALKINKKVPIAPNAEYAIAYENNLNAGNATITCTPNTNNFVGKKVIKCKIAKKKLNTLKNNVEIFGVNNSYIADGSEITPELTISYNGLPVLQSGVYGSSDVAVTYVKNVYPGTASVIIKPTPKKNGGTGNFAGSKKINFKILGKDFCVSSNSVSMSEVFTGKQIRPDLDDLLVVDSENGNRLVSGVNFKPKYLKQKLGQTYGEIVLMGVGIYKTKNLTVRFDILPMDVTSNDLVVSPIKDQRYRGKAIKPKLNIRVNKRKLVKGRDYMVTYENNLEVGTATAKILFIGNYSGSVEQDFEII